jgi:hypothetical protein
MDFPLPLTLVLMMLEEEARSADGAVAAAAAPAAGIPRSSGVFSVVEPADRAGLSDRSGAQASPRVA